MQSQRGECAPSAPSSAVSAGGPRLAQWLLRWQLPSQVVREAHAATEDAQETAGRGAPCAHLLPGELPWGVSLAPRCPNSTARRGLSAPAAEGTTCWRPLGADAVPMWVAFRPFLCAWHDAAKESWLGAKLEALGTWVLKTTHLSSWCAPEVCRACLRVPARSRAPTPHPCSLASHEHWALGLSREEPRGGGSSKGPSL